VSVRGTPRDKALEPAILRRGKRPLRGGGEKRLEKTVKPGKKKTCRVWSRPKGKQEIGKGETIWRKNPFGEGRK